MSDRIPRRDRWRDLVSDLVEVSEQFTPQGREALPDDGAHRTTTLKAVPQSLHYSEQPLSLLTPMSERGRRPVPLARKTSSTSSTERFATNASICAARARTRVPRLAVKEIF